MRIPARKAAQKRTKRGNKSTVAARKAAHKRTKRGYERAVRSA